MRLASQPAVMGKVLGIVYRTIATHLIHKAGYTKATAQTGAVTRAFRHAGKASCSHARKPSCRLSRR
jgi:hypothetical protein